ncbi:MAG TPA: ABC transporter permease [Gemmatimonadaceae bacterium]
MSAFRALSAGLRALFRRADVDRDTADELSQWLDAATRENIRAGMSPADAVRKARLEMGSMTAAAEESRSGGWETAVESVWRDVTYGFRSLRRTPGFAAAAIATIALGVGANTAMFSVVNTVILRPLPYRDASRVALLWTNDARRSLHREATAYRTIMDWKASNRSFADIGYFTTNRVAPMSNDPGGGRGRTRTALVSANVFGVLGVAPALGRVISDDDLRDKAPVAVISHSFWQRWFHGRPDVLGKQIMFDDASKFGIGGLTIVGVMPDEFYFPDKLTEIWAPATIYWRFERESVERFPSWARRWTAVARLREGVSYAEALADLDRIGRQLSATYKSTESDFPGFEASVISALDSVTGQQLQTSLLVLLGAVTLVLLVACVNVANLLLARGAARHQEFAVRRALGAARGRLVRQLVAECMVLALAGGGLGVLLATWGTSALGVAASAYVPRISEITTDGRVLGFALLASVIAGLTFGLAPSLRLSAADAAETLREGARGTGRSRLRRSQNLLVVVECAMALMLLTGSGLLLRSLNRVNAVDPGFDPSKVLTVRMEFPSDPPPSAEERTNTSVIAPARARNQEAMLADLVDRVHALPGVDVVGLIDDLFLSGQGHASITFPDRAGEATSGELNDGAVTPGFFSALRVPLRQGRLLTRDDAAQKIRALWQPIRTDISLADKERMAVAEPVVVNEAFVRRFFPSDNPVGKKFCVDPANKTYWYEIVGVIGDMRRQGLEHDAIPEYFGPFLPSSNGRADLLVRTSGEPLALAATVRQGVQRAIPGVTIVSISTADSQLGDFSAQRIFQTWLLTMFAALALALAAIGIFGIVHFAVAERTREIGVRMALGASPSEVMRLVLAQGMRTPLVGIGIGLGVSAVLTRVMSHLLFGIGATDPVTFVGVSAVLAAVAALACYLAGRGAVRVDPVQALRQG